MTCHRSFFKVDVRLRLGQGCLKVEVRLKVDTRLCQFMMTGMTPGALGASVIHLPRRGYDVRSYVPMNESCRFEAHVGTSNFTGSFKFQIQRMVLLS